MKFMHRPAEFATNIVHKMETKATRGASVLSLSKEPVSSSPRRNVAPPSYVNDESWRHDMLIALQSSASPEPIRVACMKPHVNGPSYFGEVYHGTLTRDEVSDLLSGGNGRYLVRESNSSPGDHILSFSTGGNILHYKLFYDVAKSMYYTESDDKTYSTLTDLMLDILNMLRFIDRHSNHINGHEIKHGHTNASEKSPKKFKRPSFTKPHNFKIHNYMHPKWCDVCNSFMWGLVNQGMKCLDCGLNVHKHCVKDVDVSCGTVTVEHKIKPEPKERRRSRPSRDESQCNELLSLLEHNIRCNYQLDCLKYLARQKYLNIERFDVEHAMNPCYCDNCCHLKDLDTPLCKTGEPPQAYSLPLGWCRFRLTISSCIYSMVTTWNIGYYSLSRETLALALDAGIGEEKSNGGPAKTFVKLTPSIICADLDSEKVEYHDSESDEDKVAQLIMQVYVKPGSFTTMGRAGSTDEIDPYFRSKDIYWIVRETDHVIPFGLLVKRVRKSSR